MTRELKKRFGAVEDRLEKIENKKKVNGKTNGKPDVLCDFNARERLEIVEKVLIIPGVDGKISAWRETVEVILKKLEDRFLKVELRGAWTPDEAKTLDARVKTLWDRPSAETFKVFIEALDGRLQKLEQVPEPASDVTTALEKRVKENTKRIDLHLGPDQHRREITDRLQVLQKAVEEIQLAPDPSKTILEFDDRLTELERKPDPSSEITMRGRPLAEWVSDMENRVGTLERKPVAGPLSNTAQGMEQEIKNLKDLGREHELELYGPEGDDNGNGLTNRIKEITQSVKTLRRKVQRVTWLSLLLFAMILLTLYLV